MQITKEKRKQVQGLSTEVIERILSQAPVVDCEPSAAVPLAGLVHIDGIGQVPVSVLREELAARA